MCALGGSPAVRQVAGTTNSGRDHLLWLRGVLGAVLSSTESQNIENLHVSVTGLGDNFRRRNNLDLFALKSLRQNSKKQFRFFEFT